VRVEIADTLESALSNGSQLSEKQAADFTLQAMGSIDDVHDETQVRKYISRLRDGEWGTMLEAYAACFLYRTTCNIWIGDLSREPMTYDPSYIFQSHDSLLSTKQMEIAGLPQPIRLIHVGGAHWDSVLVETEGHKRTEL